MTEETRNIIFNQLRNVIAQHTPPMVVAEDLENVKYEIMGNKAVPYGHDKKIVPGMYFCSIAHNKNAVAFYFFPAYMNPKLIDLAPGIAKCLKGKTCFHFSKEEQINENELHAILKLGIKAWYDAGYML